MSWKNWPYWLKGGIILDVVYLLVVSMYVITFLIENISQSIFILLYFISFPAFLILRLIEYDSHNVITYTIIISFLIYFILGALIGLIYGKIKNSRKRKEANAEK